MRFWRKWQGHVTDNLSAFADGVLPASQSERISEHLKACESCHQELEEIRFGAALAKHLTLMPAPEGLWNSLERRWAERAAAGSPPRAWRGWFAGRASRWAAASAAIVLLAAALTFVILQRRPTPAQAAPFELGPYLQSVETAPEEARVRAISSPAPSFASVDRQVALEVAGFGASSADLEPLPGYSLLSCRVARVDGNPVAQLVFGNGEDAFSLFVAPRRLKFLFGDDSCVETKVRGISCQKVNCDLQATYVFRQGPLQCVLVSKSLGPERAAGVMRYFMAALKRNRPGD